MRSVLQTFASIDAAISWAVLSFGPGVKPSLAQLVEVWRFSELELDLVSPAATPVANKLLPQVLKDHAAEVELVGLLAPILMSKYLAVISLRNSLNANPRAPAPDKKPAAPAPAETIPAPGIGLSLDPEDERPN